MQTNDDVRLIKVDVSKTPNEFLFSGTFDGNNGDVPVQFLMSLANNAVGDIVLNQDLELTLSYNQDNAGKIYRIKVEEV